MKSVLAFSGSLSSDSINHQLVQYAASRLTGVNVNVISLRDHPLPLFSTDEERQGIPDGVRQLQTLFDSADGFLISVPEYNSSLPAGFKNAIDWISRTGGKPFRDRPVVLMSTSPGGRGGASVQQHLIRVLPYWGADVVGHFSLPRFSENFLNGEVVESLRPELLQVLAALQQRLQ
jgi:chromate reductase, NAD(P)H dehydrogenase (quinone)